MQRRPDHTQAAEQEQYSAATGYRFLHLDLDAYPGAALGATEAILERQRSRPNSSYRLMDPWNARFP